MAKDKKNKPSSPSLSISGLKALAAKLFGPIGRHSTFIVAMLALGLIIYSGIMVTIIIGQSDDQDYRNEQASERISSSFDKQTIQKVDNLRNSADTSSIDLPDGRRNPFNN